MKVQLSIRDPEVNPLELIAVAEDLDSRGISHATIYKGNECIWVSYGLVNAYYIFRGGKVVDIQID
jgi:hypothetical protein